MLHRTILILVFTLGLLLPGFSVSALAPSSDPISCPYFLTYQSRGSENNEVIKIQSFLQKIGVFHTEINGVYDNETINAIKSFQERYRKNVLDPWGMRNPSGDWYQSTRAQANALVGCAEGTISLDNGRDLTIVKSPISFKLSDLPVFSRKKETPVITQAPVVVQEVATRFERSVSSSGSSRTVNSSDSDRDGVDVSIDCDDTNYRIAGPTTWYADADADGYVNLSDQEISCSQPENYIALVTENDCNDASAVIYPGSTEIANDSIDQDCDGSDLVVDVVAPYFTANPSISNSSYFGFDIDGTLSEDGEVSCILQYQGETAPTTENILNAEAGSGATLLWSDSGDVNYFLDILDFSVSFSSLQTQADYHLYCTSQDYADTPNTQETVFDLAFSGNAFSASDKIIVVDTPDSDHANNVIATFEDEYGESISSRVEVISNFTTALNRALEIGAETMIYSYTGITSKIGTMYPYWDHIALFMPLGSNSSVRLSSPSSIPVVVSSCAGNTQCETAYGPGLEFWDEDENTDTSYGSSNSNARVAAKLLMIKESLDSSWWEARYRARVTATRTLSTHPLSEEWNEEHGYGQIDVAAAISYAGSIPSDPF